jgi:hypothetical protein
VRLFNAMKSFFNAMKRLFNAMKSFFNAVESFADGVESFTGAAESFFNAVESFADAVESFTGAAESFFNAAESFFNAVESFADAVESFTGAAESSPLSPGAPALHVQPGMPFAPSLGVGTTARWLLGCATLTMFAVSAHADEKTPTFTQVDPPVHVVGFFGVHLDTDAQDPIAELVAAGHDQLVALCSEVPSASVRIFNPLASGASADISCAAVLEHGVSATAPAEAASGGERTAEARQPWSLLGLGRSILLLGAGIFFNRVGCNNPRADNPDACRNVVDFGFGGLGVLCAFL